MNATIRRQLLKRIKQLEQIKEEIKKVRENEQEKKGNLPTGLSSGPAAEGMENAIRYLGEAIESIDCCIGSLGSKGATDAVLTTLATKDEMNEKDIRKQLLDEKNVRSFERQLTKIIEEMCDGVGLQFREWDVDEQLYLALKNAPKLKSITPILTRYHSLYDMAREMGIDDRIATPFQWVYGLGV